MSTNEVRTTTTPHVSRPNGRPNIFSSSERGSFAPPPPPPPPPPPLPPPSVEGTPPSSEPRRMSPYGTDPLPLPRVGGHPQQPALPHTPPEADAQTARRKAPPPPSTAAPPAAAAPPPRRPGEANPSHPPPPPPTKRSLNPGPAPPPNALRTPDFETRGRTLTPGTEPRDPNTGAHF